MILVAKRENLFKFTTETASKRFRGFIETFTWYQNKNMFRIVYRKQ